LRWFAECPVRLAVQPVASPGVDDLRWTAPVRPGDTPRARVTVAEARVLTMFAVTIPRRRSVLS
jgi:acyl dehydratase